MEDYNERSNDGAVTDSLDEFNHGVYPTDPDVMGYQKIKVRVVIWLGVLGVLMCNGPGGTLVSGEGLYVLLRQAAMLTDQVWCGL